MINNPTTRSVVSGDKIKKRYKSDFLGIRNKICN